MLRSAARVLLILCGSILSGAELKHVRDYSTHEPKDTGVLFRVLVTQDQDILIWVAKGDGLWRLTRIRQWLDRTPLEETINVPGIVVPKESPKDPEFLALLDMSLNVADGGAGATAVSEGLWKVKGEKGGRYEIFTSEIDLRSFRVSQTTKEAKELSRDSANGHPKPVSSGSRCAVVDGAEGGGSWLEKCEKSSVRVVSANGAVIGVVRDPKPRRTVMKFATAANRLFVLVIEDGHKIKVYEVRD